MAKLAYNADKLGESLQKQFQANNERFFAFAWREAQGEVLKQASRFALLAEWLDKEIELCGNLINVFCPADRTEWYTNGMKDEYLQQIQKFAVLTHLRELLIDERTTNAQRENIEYTACKLYGIRYSEELEDYV